MILGLTGLTGSGKDTVAAHLIKEHGFERRAFADPLKKSFAALFEMKFEDVEAIKNDPNWEIAVQCLGESGLTGQRFWNIREMLQRYGTESHRDIFGDDFWVDLTLPVDGFYIGKAIVVSDCRFPNEAVRIHRLGGYVIRLVRGGINAHSHRSESGQNGIEADFVIANNGTIPELFQRVDYVIERICEEEASSSSL